MASVHDNLSLDDKKTENSEEKDEEQATPGVENTLTEEEGWPTTVRKNRAQPTIHDLSSQHFAEPRRNFGH